MTLPSKEWREGTVTISREELGAIISNNIKDVLKAAAATGDRDLFNLIKELLLTYSAAVATDVFKPLGDEDSLEIE